MHLRTVEGDVSICVLHVRQPVRCRHSDAVHRIHSVFFGPEDKGCQVESVTTAFLATQLAHGP